MRECTNCGTPIPTVKVQEWRDPRRNEYIYLCEECAPDVINERVIDTLETILEDLPEFLASDPGKVRTILQACKDALQKTFENIDLEDLT